MAHNRTSCVLQTRQRRFDGASAAPTFVPVEVVGTVSGGLSLVSPDGYRVEGLAAADVAEILRRLR